MTRSRSRITRVRCCKGMGRSSIPVPEVRCSHPCRCHGIFGGNPSMDLDGRTEDSLRSLVDDTNQ